MSAKLAMSASQGMSTQNLGDGTTLKLKTPHSCHVMSAEKLKAPVRRKMKARSGNLEYFGTLTSAEHRLSVEIDEGFADFYRSLVPKSIRFQKPRFSAHISLLRNEKVLNLPRRTISFHYNPWIEINETYVWLNVSAADFEPLRQELGLQVWPRYTLPPNGKPDAKQMHITLGNFKSL